MKINRKTEFLDVPWYQSPDFDKGVNLKGRTIRQDIGVLIRSLGMLKGYWHLLALQIALAIAYGSIGILVPFLEKAIVDDALPVRDWGMFFFLFGMILFSDLGNYGFKEGISGVISPNAMARMGLWMQSNLYKRIQGLSMAKIERKGIGEFMYRMHKDASMATSFAWTLVGQLVGELYMVILFIVFMSVFDPKLLWLVLIYESLNFFVFNWIAKQRQMVNFYGRRSKELADSRMQEGFAGIETVKTFGRIKAEGGQFVNRVGIQMRVEMIRKAIYLLEHVFMRHAGVFPWWRDRAVQLFLMYQVIEGQVTYGTVIAAMLYLKEMRKPIEKLVSLWVNLRIRIVPLERVLQIWDTPPSVTAPDNPLPVPALKGQIDVKDVRYSYDNGVEVLHGIDMSISPGEFVAIVGPSGSGKSTFLNLLVRLNDPDSGSVMADGIDLRKFDPIRYRNALGVVMQETFLSKETLRWNLLLGDFFATDEQMIRALETCRLKAWFEKLPDGLDSFLDEGSKVSVGEKQRLGVVRALLRRSDVLLLDEPTSSLDLDTEQEVMEVIHRVRQGKTTVMVTHRLSTIVDADRIYVMRAGNIVEVGRHQELLDANGLYAELVAMYRQGQDAA